MPEEQRQHLETLLQHACRHRYVSRVQMHERTVTLHIGRVMYTLDWRRATSLLEEALRQPRPLQMNTGLPSSTPW